MTDRVIRMLQTPFSSSKVLKLLNDDKVFAEVGSDGTLRALDPSVKVRLLLSFLLTDKYNMAKEILKKTASEEESKWVQIVSKLVASWRSDDDGGDDAKTSATATAVLNRISNDADALSDPRYWSDEVLYMHSDLVPQVNAEKTVHFKISGAFEERMETKRKILRSRKALIPVKKKKKNLLKTPAPSSTVPKRKRSVMSTGTKRPRPGPPPSIKRITKKRSRVMTMIDEEPTMRRGFTYQPKRKKKKKKKKPSAAKGFSGLGDNMLKPQDRAEILKFHSKSQAKNPHPEKGHLRKIKLHQHFNINGAGVKVEQVKIYMKLNYKSGKWYLVKKRVSLAKDA